MNKQVVYTLKGILFILIIIAFIYIGTRDFSEKQIVDNEKFDQEYQNVSKDNVFVYANAADIYAKLKNGTAVIFMGFPSNIWSGYYANILNETAKQKGIDEILYYDFQEDRQLQNATYQSIVLKLNEYILTMDDGTKEIYAPTLIIVKNGKIIAYDNETAINIGTVKPENYWTTDKIGMKMSSFANYFDEYLRI